MVRSAETEIELRPPETDGAETEAEPEAPDPDAPPLRGLDRPLRFSDARDDRIPAVSESSDFRPATASRAEEKARESFWAESRF